MKNQTLANQSCSQMRKVMIERVVRAFGFVLLCYFVFLDLFRVIINIHSKVAIKECHFLHYF